MIISIGVMRGKGDNVQFLDRTIIRTTGCFTMDVKPGYLIYVFNGFWDHTSNQACEINRACPIQQSRGYGHAFADPLPEGLSE